MNEEAAGAFPALGMELTHLRVVADAQRGHEARCFLRDPDGHLIELSEYRG